MPLLVILLLLVLVLGLGGIAFHLLWILAVIALVVCAFVFLTGRRNPL
jgi:hypothetical protein